MTKAWAFGAAAVALVVAGTVAAFAIAWRPAIPATDPPSPQNFDVHLVKRGRDLAAIGNCASCHTVRGGQDFAGGLPVATPFGTIYSSNITPDAETGIGHWPESAFRRAMRAGVDRNGRHLYPTFPYDHFTNVSDEDDRALYAYLMTRQPVRSTAPANQLPFPLDQRFVIAGWKLLFLHRGAYQPDPARDPEWNRGAYLVEGLAHCGACHTPRNALGAERESAAFAGGDVEQALAEEIGLEPARAAITADRRLVGDQRAHLECNIRRGRGPARTAPRVRPTRSRCCAHRRPCRCAARRARRGWCRRRGRRSRACSPGRAHGW